ncbi:hypothetical protein Q73_01135 [Bacillus coahuilensis m2-6]|uniref:DUF3899 domain-containing protein n=1 Tax=Bacillus coahuilensis p1.1.43 TaxID=1150625 RepID=A0A147KBZ6_9BACI|nr:hypothetical protein [Bacillus coahuilensis]KUP09022.1 hypothetical protein Q75_01590 [Bacillus coahuilensis p1.1.43]KUP09867.1 hypothetical protein Q73_01135 [Bacillus coahuilensis m2-6]
MLKYVGLFLLTIIMETGGLYLISIVIGMEFMEIYFLGSIAAFGAIWLYSLAIHNSNKVHNASERAATGIQEGETKAFDFKFSPVMVGMVLMILISLVGTLIYY